MAGWYLFEVHCTRAHEVRMLTLWKYREFGRDEHDVH